MCSNDNLSYNTVQQGHNVGYKCRPHVPAKYLVRLKYQNDVRNQR